jgi:hypothetical protein
MLRATAAWHPRQVGRAWWVKTDLLTHSLVWITHSAYEPQVGNWMARVARSGQRAPDCAGVVPVIFAAATDHSGRLRCPAKASSLLALCAILPDALFSGTVSAGMSLPPGR